MSESRKIQAPAKHHMRAADRLLLIVEHEAGCHCCQHASRDMDAAYEAFEIVLARWVHEAKSSRGLAWLWFIVACCSWLTFAAYIAVRMRG